MRTVSCRAATVALLGVDGFVDAGDDDGGVAGVFAGRIDGVLVPGTIGQAGVRKGEPSQFAASAEFSWARLPEGADWAE